MMNKKGYTLVEIMVVAALIAILFSAFLGLLFNSGTFWDKGQSKITEQEAARIAMDTIVKDLRDSIPSWVNITPGQIVFFKPVFDLATGNYSSNYYVRYRQHPSDSSRLQKCDRKTGVLACRNITDYIESVAFYGSTDDCQTFVNSTVPNCPRIRITISTNKTQSFNLTTDVYLRNNNTVSVGELPDPEEEGEF